MIIGNFKSKADEIEKKALQLKLLQISVENESEVSKRLRAYSSNEPPPVPVQEKSLLELERDEMSLRARLSDSLKEIKIRPEVISQAIQGYLSEGNGIENIIILVRSIPSIRKKFSFIAPELIDSAFLANIFKATVQEYRFSAGFAFGKNGNLPVGEAEILNLLPDENKLSELEGKLIEIIKQSPPASENKRLSESLVMKIKATRQFKEALLAYLNNPNLDRVDRSFVIEEAVKLVNTSILLSSSLVARVINQLRYKKSENVFEYLNLLSTKLQPEEVYSQSFDALSVLDLNPNILTAYEPPEFTERELQEAGKIEVEDYAEPQVEDVFKSEYQKAIEYADFIKEWSRDRNSFIMPSMKEAMGDRISYLEKVYEDITELILNNDEKQIDIEVLNIITEALKEYEDGARRFNLSNEEIKAYIDSQSAIPHNRKEVKKFFESVGYTTKKQKESLGTPSIETRALYGQSDDRFANKIKQVALGRLKTDPNYDPENKPDTRINETIGLGMKKNKRSDFVPKRIKIGKGVQLVQDVPKYRIFGKYVVHNDQLGESNRLNFKYPSLAQITHLKPIQVSDNYKEFIFDILESDKVNMKHYESLSPDEKTHFQRVIEGAGLVNKFKIKKLDLDIDEKEFDRFNVLKGSVLSGNNNSKVVKELQILTVKFMKKGRLSNREGQELLLYLMEL